MIRMMKLIRYGMIGGGQGAFIGPVHRAAAALSGNWQLVAGALSAEPNNARLSGSAIGLPPERNYGSWPDMLAREQALPADQRIEVVVVVTPNHAHAQPAIAAMEAGFDVLVEKPLAGTLADAKAIARAAAATRRLVGVTYTYTGYPMVKQARQLVTDGSFGPVRRVMVKYTQDWLSRATEIYGNKQAEWRTDPARSGQAGAFGDIGTHAANLVEFVTGQRIVSLAAELSMLPGRLLDDDGAALFRLSGGARGTLVASQVCVGDDNDLAISVYCEEAALHWQQENPNTLSIGRRDKPLEIWRAGSNRGYLAPDVRQIQRTPGGHPEGYLEAFANIYAAFGNHVRGDAAEGDPGFGTLDDALAGMAFIKACLASSNDNSAWTNVEEPKP